MPNTSQTLEGCRQQYVRCDMPEETTTGWLRPLSIIISSFDPPMTEHAGWFLGLHERLNAVAPSNSLT